MVGQLSEESQALEVTVETLISRRGSVLSDQDVKAEIRLRGLITTEDGEDCSENSGVRWACYDFRIGHVIGKNKGVVTDQKESIILRPGEMVTLLSREWVHLPNNITGLVIPRNKQAQRGILILNAGHVDPGYHGQVMAQVVNLSDQDRSIQLDDCTQSVFAIVFSYLHSPAILEPRPRQGDKRVTELHAAALEQAETLVIAESVMRQKFVAQDAFTRLVYLNAFGFLALVGILVGVSTAFFDLRDLATTVFDRKTLLVIGLMAVAVLVGVFFAQVIMGPVMSALLRKWTWWRRNILS